MAHFDTTPTNFGSASAASRFSLVFSAIIAKVVAWNDSRVTRNALSALTDRELDDIGLCRGDIDYIAGNNTRR
ncbi:MAG: DUF1127 domain-containing protein [Pseudomonadota bacterium]